MCGIISNMKVKQSKKGNRFCVFNLEDFTGQGECIVFPKTYENFRERIRNDAIVSVVGRAEENGNTIKVIVDEINPITKISPNGTGRSSGGQVIKEITIRIDADKFKPENIYSIRNFLNSTGGNCNILFNILKDTEKGPVHRIYKIENLNIVYDEFTAKTLAETFGKNNITIN